MYTDKSTAKPDFSAVANSITRQTETSRALLKRESEIPNTSVLQRQQNSGQLPALAPGLSAKARYPAGGASQGKVLEWELGRSRAAKLTGMAVWDLTENQATGHRAHAAAIWVFVQLLSEFPCGRHLLF